MTKEQETERVACIDIELSDAYRQHSDLLSLYTSADALSDSLSKVLFTTGSLLYERNGLLKQDTAKNTQNEDSDSDISSVESTMSEKKYNL